MSTADPIGQGGPIQIDAGAGKDLALTIQWQMIRILGHKHVRQESRAGQPSCNRSRRGYGLNNLVAPRTRELRSDVPDDLEARGNVLEHLCGVFAERLQ